MQVAKTSLVMQGSMRRNGLQIGMDLEVRVKIYSL